MGLEVEQFILSAIKANYGIMTNTSQRILVVAFSGVYRPGSEGNDDALLMHALATAAVESTSPEAIILDFGTSNTFGVT